VVEQECRVEGMTCGHCRQAVSSELAALAGVRDVTVDLGSGTARVVSDERLDRAAVSAAIDAAGYELAS
jgi:copper chaperone CopZ